MKTPDIQRSPCYSAVSALLRNPLPDCSNCSPLLPLPLPHSGLSINTSLVSSGQTLYQAAPLETSNTIYANTSLLLRFTAESSREFRRNAVPWGSWTTSRGKCRCSPLQIVNSVPFCLFSLYLYPLSAPFSILSLLPFLISLASLPSLLTLLINSLSS